jgi:hypothetical protein
MAADRISSAYLKDMLPSSQSEEEDEDEDGEESNSEVRRMWRERPERKNRSSSSDSDSPSSPAGTTSPDDSAAGSSKAAVPRSRHSVHGTGMSGGDTLMGELQARSCGVAR